MTEIETMLNDGMVPDFEELYRTGKLVPVRGESPLVSPITPETPGFQCLSEEQIREILEIEGA